jgi:toxin ParE1/3/4
MANLVISPLAEADLNDILEFIARDKPEAAVRWVQRLRERCEFIAQNPGVGDRRPEFKTGEFRSTYVGKYVIFFRAIPEGVDIARVVRGERDVRNL